MALVRCWIAPRFLSLHSHALRLSFYPHSPRSCACSLRCVRCFARLLVCILALLIPLAENPDGNGGIYRALHVSGAVADMERRGVSLVHVFAVDNAAVRVADPVFMGYCLEQEADVGSKVCPKASAEEKVGGLCKR